MLRPSKFHHNTKVSECLTSFKAFIQGIFRLGSPETRVQVYPQIYYNSSMTDTSVSLLTLVINL